ncbi:MAG: hypothetical protein RIB98_03680 [Acidimicrobiales bacterium]
MIKLGTWRTREGTSMVAVRGKGPGCVIEFASGPFARWIVSEPLPDGI